MKKYQHKGVTFEMEIDGNSIKATADNGVVGTYAKNSKGDWFCTNYNSAPRNHFHYISVMHDFITTEWAKSAKYESSLPQGANETPNLPFKKNENENNWGSPE